MKVHSVAAVVFCGLLSHGCTTERHLEQSDYKLYGKVELGMKLDAVEKLLGSALVGEDGKMYFGAPADSSVVRSPIAPASIAIVTSNNVVVLKRFYGKTFVEEESSEGVRRSDYLP